MTADPNIPRSMEEKLEDQARIELISLILHQWDKTIRIDEKYLRCIDVIHEARLHPIRSIFFPNRKKLEPARDYMGCVVGRNVTCYHHSLASGLLLWNGIKKLRKEIHKPAFKKMIACGTWSPAAFIVQNKIPLKCMFRVTARETDLGGLLPYRVGPGRLTLLFFRDAAQDSGGLFNHSCCGANFVMDVLTFLVDSIHPGLRKMRTDPGCSYSKKIKCPFY